MSDILGQTMSKIMGNGATKKQFKTNSFGHCRISIIFPYTVDLI